MKEKFERNVATDIPKTRLHEPSLPWKLTEEDAPGDIRTGNNLKAGVSPSSPFKVRAIFPVLLVIAIFGVTAYLISGAFLENEKMHSNIVKKEGELSLMQISLMKTSAEKEIIAKNSAQLEKKVNDLTAQKELFASVIESLTKKGEEPDADKK